MEFANKSSISSILIGCSIVNYPFMETPIFRIMIHLLQFAHVNPGIHHHHSPPWPRLVRGNCLGHLLGLDRVGTVRHQKQAETAASESRWPVG